MFQIEKILNSNSFIGIKEEEKKEYLVMGKGVVFGRNVNELVEERPGDVVYSMTELSERGTAEEIINSVSPICLELANEVLNLAEKEFGKIDRSIFFPLADHIEFALRRIKNHEQISNPLTEDIRALFYKEFKVAQCMEQLVWERLQIQIDEHEIGYIALHVHSAIEDEKVSHAMQVARAVRECVLLVEKQIGKQNAMSLAYNRFVSHIRYMIARSIQGEVLSVSMNDYIEEKFPKAFQLSKKICEKIEDNLKIQLNEIEIGYLAIHIEHIADNGTNNK